MKTRVKYILLFSVIALLVAVVPFVIMVIAGITPPESWRPVSGGTITEQTWISFSGAYIGAIIGAIGAIVIMFRTLRESRKEKIDSRRYADYLYIRDSLEQCIGAIDDSCTVDVISNMFELCFAEFNLPDLERLFYDWKVEKKMYFKLQRSIAQTIIPSKENAKNAVNSTYENFRELWAWEFAFEEFLSQIIVDFRLKDDLEDWEKHRASTTDKLYEYLSTICEEQMFRINMDTLEPIKYSFSKYFSGVRYINEPESITMGGEKARTEFMIVYMQAIKEYQEDYHKITKNINKTAEELLSSLKTEFII